MEPIEKLLCIKHINPEAHCVVDGNCRPIYDRAHKGKRPTIRECEDVLETIQAAMSVENEISQENELIKTEESVFLREVSIQRLRDRGVELNHN